MVALKPLLLLLALGVEALAGPAKPASCTTILGTKTIKNVPTSTTTAINKITIIKKVVRKVNVVVVPVAKTTTIRTTHVATVTSVDQKTDTAWVTLTSPSTSWFTITVTIYDPSTTVSTAVTTKDITVTVPRPAGFTPIGDSDELFPSTLKKRDARIQTTLPGGTRPQSVRCVVDKPQYSTKTVSTTVQGPRRTLKAATKTRMSTISTTTTETQYPPNVKTTMTTITRPVDTSFTFVSSTIMMYTETVTVESQVPKATVYDMCQEDNILSTANNGGYFVGHLGFSGLANNQAQVINSARSPKDCCQACAANPSCMTSWFFGNDLICNLFMAQDPKTCANNAQPLVARYLTDTQNIHWIFSNGPCGHWENAGSTN